MTQTPNAAYYQDVKARAQARALLDPTLIPHGTSSGYSYWGCRCEICTAANTRRCESQKSARLARSRRAES